MSRAHAVSRAQIARAIAAMEERGHAPKGLLCYPDGSVAVLTEAPAMPVPSNENSADWLDLAGDEAKGNA